ncbi:MULTISPECIES: VOC family protein [Listeria]|uniref:VOC family protein n=1 Tax=Listeria TaxID=1637 RepID=UPI000B58F12C|nr:MULTISPECIES: VOC family protein [Listeria]
MIRKFEGVNIAGPSAAELVDFYHEKLGIPIVFPGHGDSVGAKLGFTLAEPGIIVWQEEAKSAPVEFVFSCESLDETYAELNARGVTDTPPRLAEWGGRELNFIDPIGNKIMILEGDYA